jgi:hypothetical protein
MHNAGAGQSQEMTLTVIDDHSDPQCLENIKKLLASCRFPHLLKATPGSGNGHSLQCNYEHAKDNCSDLIYFVEDDYLHSPDSIKEMLGGYHQLRRFINHDLVIFPCDYPSLYAQFNPSGIVLGENRYWRNINQTTATFLLSKNTFEENWDHYKAMTRYGLDPGISEETTINLVYRKVPCFSPMPSLTVHMAGSETISPFVNWTRWWQQSKPEFIYESSVPVNGELVLNGLNP